MAPNKRDRAQANSAVTDADYERVLLSVASRRAWHDILGPTLVTGAHQVLPHMVTSASGWIAELIQAGCTNGVIWPARFEMALRRNASTLPAKTNVELYIAQATDHMRHI